MLFLYGLGGCLKRRHFVLLFEHFVLRGGNISFCGLYIPCQVLCADDVSANGELDTGVAHLADVLPDGCHAHQSRYRHLVEDVAGVLVWKKERCVICSLMIILWEVCWNMNWKKKFIMPSGICRKSAGRFLSKVVSRGKNTKKLLQS